MKIHDTLSKELDTQFKGTELVPVKEEKKEVEVLSNEAEADFESVRDTLNDLIETGNMAIKDMHAIAQHDEQARSFEVLATLIKTVSETAEKLLTTHEKKKKLKETMPEGRKIADTGDIQIDKAVFVGTTSDLLKTLKSKDND